MAMTHEQALVALQRAEAGNSNLAPAAPQALAVDREFTPTQMLSVRAVIEDLQAEKRGCRKTSHGGVAKLKAADRAECLEMAIDYFAKLVERGQHSISASFVAGARQDIDAIVHTRSYSRYLDEKIAKANARANKLEERTNAILMETARLLSARAAI